MRQSNVPHAYSSRPNADDHEIKNQNGFEILSREYIQLNSTMLNVESIYFRFQAQRNRNYAASIDELVDEFLTRDDKNNILLRRILRQHGPSLLNNVPNREFVAYLSDLGHVRP